MLGEMDAWYSKGWPAKRGPRAEEAWAMDSSTGEAGMEPRPAAASRVSLSIIIMPGQTNHLGKLHGGVLLRLADECGSISALRHVGKGQITTAAMDSMTFLGPFFLGERV